MSRRRKHALKRRRRTLRRLALLPLPPRDRGEPADAAAWPILPAHVKGAARRDGWMTLFQSRSLFYASVATLVGLVVLVILRWMDSRVSAG